MKWISIHSEFIKIPFKIHKVYTSIYVLLRILSGLLPSFYILAYSRFINGIVKLYTGSIEYMELMPVFLYIVGLSIFKYFNGNLLGYISTKLSLEMLSVLKLESIEKRSKLKYKLIENKDSWDLIHRIVKGLSSEITKGFYNLFDLIELSIKIISITVIIGTFSPIVAGIILICFIPIVIVSIRSGEESYDGFISFQKIQRRLESFENILTSKEYVDERTIFNYSSFFTKRWMKYYQESTKLYLGIKKKLLIKVKITSLIVTTILLGMIVVLMNLAVSNIITIGLFTSTVMQLLELGSKISWALSGIVYQLANSNSYMRDYKNFCALEEITNITNPAYEKRVHRIEFQNVSFKYPGNEKYTLRNINLKIDSNKSYAVVGENGAGKSTLIKLLLKLYDSYEGKILINGIDLKKIDNTTSLFAVVFQDYAKYEISILDNILFGNEQDMKTEKILSVFENLNFPINEERFPNGLYTELGRLTNKNTDISIGQWQKVAMIRAIAEKGEFYILDEPTAALDPVSESVIYKDFIEILNNNPAIIITHRLGAARLADEIIVIKNGTIKEVGPHNTLLEKEGLYKEMYEKQRSWYNDEKTTLWQGNVS